MSHVFPRHTRVVPPVAAEAKGCYIFDGSGKRYLDGSGGAAVSCLGHAHEAVISAVQKQAAELAYAHTGFFTSAPAERLADLLIAHTPKELDRVYFVSGGSEAVEAALKLARQYCLETGEPKRSRLVSRKQSYHGNTLGALAAGGNMWRREPFGPLMIETSHIDACYAYRGRHEGENDADYGERMAQQLEDEFLRLGPETVMAFIAEPVVGATLGAVPPVDGYFSRIREICDRYGVLLILDEVMCGMGRTGTLFAFEQEGIVPDIVTIAKGLGGGYQPIGAMICSSAIYCAVENGSGFFQHGHTYLAHPTACAAGEAVVETLVQDHLIERCDQQGRKLRQVLESALGQHPHIGDIRGRGLFCGVELVEDRESKKPFDPSLAVNTKIKKAAFDAGLICYPMGGTVDGHEGDHVLLAPPFIIEDHQIDELVNKLATAIDSVI